MSSHSRLPCLEQDYVAADARCEQIWMAVLMADQVVVVVALVVLSS